MSSISRSGPRRWIATLLLLVMALATAAQAEVSACARASRHSPAELAPHADLGEEMTEHGAPIETGTPPAYTICGAAALVAATETGLARSPLTDEAPIQFNSGRPPGPEPEPHYRPPRQV